MARVPLQCPDDGRRDRLLLLGQSRLRNVVPPLKVFGSPSQCLVQMTLVTRVRPAGGHGFLHAGAANLVAAERFEQAVAGVGHVAVVARAARRVGGMVAMRGQVQLALETFVALCARLIGVHTDAELIFRPLLDGPSIVRRAMHRMAREAG